jgi:formylglycine-generating enzyme required for sulfatase activity
VLAIVASVGVYLWRPGEVTAFIASLSNTATSTAADVAALRTAAAEPSSPPALAATAPPEALASAAPIELAATPSPATPVADGSPISPAKNPAGTFRECDACPLMLNIAGGTFLMGAPADELGRKAYEGPQRKVAMAPFAIGVTEVTFEEWDACLADGGCGKYAPDDKRLGRGKLPVTYVSWKDATAYAAWLTKKTGRAYRLPTEAEWEYTGRGGTTTPFWWGALFDATNAGTGAAPQSVDALQANPLGLRGVTGNVREWTQDCYVNTFASAPLDGRSVEVARCGQRVVRGGTFLDTAEALRIAARGRIDPTSRDRLTGFRVAAAP